MTSRLDDAAAALPAPDDIFGLPVDHDWREVNRYQPTGDGHEVIVSVARIPAGSGASNAQQQARPAQQVEGSRWSLRMHNAESVHVGLHRGGSRLCQSR
jgi:hypothetical protein